MAQNTTTAVTETYSQLTNADATKITVQNRGKYALLISGTTGATAPSDDNGAIEVPPKSMLVNESLSALWPGIAAVRVYARAYDGDTSGSASCTVMFSHD